MKAEVYYDFEVGHWVAMAFYFSSQGVRVYTGQMEYGHTPELAIENLKFYQNIGSNNANNGDQSKG